MTAATLLPRSTPEEQGISSRAILRFVDALETNLREVHSLMIVRHGHVIAEGWWDPYDAQTAHSMFSVSKSFTATAVGFAVAEGLLDLDDTVVSLLPDDLPEVVGDNLAAMRVRHLLTMTTGHAVDTAGAVRVPGANWSRTLLALPVDLAPGSTFVYNTGATYLLSAILASVTGERLLDYLTPRLFEPLGIEGARWEQCPRGIDVGGWGLSITTEQLARFGLLYLHGGVWQGEQVVPADWVAAATTLQVENGGFLAGDDRGQGYGYQFWRSQHGAYRADGAFGQLSIAFPQHDLLVVLTSGLSDMQRELDVVWDHLLPVIGSHDPLREDATSADLLRERLAGLRLEIPAGFETSTTAARIAGRRFTVPHNSLGIVAVALVPGDGETVLAISNEHGEQRVRCGAERWIGGTATVLGDTPQPVAASGTWADAAAFVARICFTETPFALTVSFDFRADEVTLGVDQNVSFGATRLLHTTAHAL